MTEGNGWGEYSKLVLKELETLASGIATLQQQMNELKQELIELRAKEDKVDELKAWKEKIDEVASPSQLKELQDEVNSLKLFKTKAVTIFMVVQFMMGLALALMKNFKIQILLVLATSQWVKCPYFSLRYQKTPNIELKMIFSLSVLGIYSYKTT